MGALSGVLFFNESIHPFAALGFVFCIMGAFVYTWERQRRSGARNVEKVEQEDNAMADFMETRPEAVPAPRPAESEVSLELSTEAQAKEMTPSHKGRSRNANEAQPVVYGASQPDQPGE